MVAHSTPGVLSQSTSIAFMGHIKYTESAFVLTLVKWSHMTVLVEFHQESFSTSVYFILIFILFLFVGLNNFQYIAFVYFKM